MSETTEAKYQVLARKYRPETFADLVGQDAMVRTLKNAFAADRIAQAFVLTGIRGTGKTSTARIIAKGLNCIGPDGNGGPTTEPCGQCEHCVAISEGRHVDIMEMDAASRTGVGDIREIIESVHYRAASARYKIYIIDEVHMLSNSAFNALLKTLEEPPEHVKFVFATTEIRKVPVTVLSRCQRFDLRRIEPEVMIKMLQGNAASENANITDDALALITRAAEGSARDAQSLLDQAISHGAGETTADQVRAMLGLADRGRVMDMFEMIMRGDAAGALAELSAQYSDGADPLAVLRDLAEITHWVSVIKITPDAAEDPTVGPDERARGQAFAAALPMRALTRMWQMLLAGLEEVSAAPNAMMASEMAVIRLTHVSTLPSPEELVRSLRDNPTPPPNSGGGSGANTSQTGGGAPAGGISGSSGTVHSPTMQGSSTPITAQGSAQVALVSDNEPALARFPRFEDVVELIRLHRDVKLLVEVETGIRLANYSPGRIEFEASEHAPADLAQRLSARLQAWTGVRWGVTLVNEGGAKTISELRDADKIALENKARDHAMVKAVLLAFPKAKIDSIVSQKEIAAMAEIEALPEVDEEWDPFEED